ncbi:hypothetical protein DRE_04158 [Drechslerella stenobrocha 248]|uniref:BTB domain-containing protein n=1 Tax=Drechslerella stenobrocha 248 TaxID=1043628 RepID=W7HRK5_9PEZI|nr:hypothetical protein DRE_04158 [Drechslerella stenobrocha 248]
MVMQFEEPPYPLLESQLNQPTFTDITLVVGADQTRIPCQRLILAENCKELAASCSDLKTTEIPLPRYDPDTVRSALRYFYTNRLQPSDFNTMNFNTLMVVYECAKGLGSQSLMERVIYEILEESRGNNQWGFSMRSSRQVSKMVESIFTLTTEGERQSPIYRSFFDYLAAIAFQENFTRDLWFTDLLRNYTDLGVELLKATFGAANVGYDWMPVSIMCSGNGCDATVGLWTRCKACRKKGVVHGTQAWDDTDEEWENQPEADIYGIGY